MNHNKNLFRRDRDTILFDDVNLRNIETKFGTPTYLFSADQIRRNISFLREKMLKYNAQTSIAYSMKNNIVPEICTIIADEVDYFETTSMLEQKIVEKILLEKKKNIHIISTNIYKPDGLIEDVIEYPNISSSEIDSAKCHSFLAIDSYHDLKNIEKVAQRLGVKPKVLIRVNPGIKMDIEETIFASANISAKCAVVISNIEPILKASKDPTIKIWLPERQFRPEFDTAERLVREAYESEYLDLVGIHCHLGSQITNIEYFDRFFEVVTSFFKIMNEELNDKLKILDLGGGYPVDYAHCECVPTIEDISKSLSKNIKNSGINPDIIIESGRFITANSGILISKITITKENSDGHKIAVLDLSTYSDLLDVLTAQWSYDYSLINELPDSDQKASWKLVGGTNDTLDQLTPRIIKCSNCKEQIIEKKEITFPRDLVFGDLIAVKSTGAYTTCFNSNY
ncbi:MAG: diaminopimelate decarboxylase family protein, partial [Candidatus Heimdallarchaeota archaeon]